MAKYTWIEFESEEEFIEGFGENPRWILSSAPIVEKSNILKGDHNVSLRNDKGRSKRRSNNKTTT